MVRNKLLDCGNKVETLTSHNTLVGKTDANLLKHEKNVKIEGLIVENNKFEYQRLIDNIPPVAAQEEE